MQHYKANLETLKQMLVREDDFGVTFNYFFDHIAGDAKFLNICKPTKKPLIKKILKSMGNQLFEGGGQVTNILLVQARKSTFVHGTCFINGLMGNLFFFEDIDMGMVALLSAPGSDMVHFIRFTSTSIGDAAGKNIVMPPPGKPTWH
jgi:hypothetical protein